MFNQTKLDAIIWDNRDVQDLESHLTELEQMPENYINSVCPKSLCEMSEKEANDTIEEIAEYLKENVLSLAEYLKEEIEEEDFNTCEDDKIISLSDFEEDDNAGWKKEIEGVTYFKVRDNRTNEFYTVSIQNEELIIE